LTRLGCAFNHNIERTTAADGGQSDRWEGDDPFGRRESIADPDPSNPKKTLNVDSPSFTPSFLSPNGASTGAKKSAGISPKAANAAPFMPKAIISSALASSPAGEALY